MKKLLVVFSYQRENCEYEVDLCSIGFFFGLSSFSRKLNKFQQSDMLNEMAYIFWHIPDKSNTKAYEVEQEIVSRMQYKSQNCDWYLCSWAKQFSFIRFQWYREKGSILSQEFWLM